MSVTLGADPEMFVADEQGMVRAVCGKLGGTKGAALDIGEGVGLQEDNVMVEYNIAPQTSARHFALAIETARTRVMDFVRTKMGQNYTASTVCTAEFPAEELASKQAMVFGCSPDFDAYAKGAAAPPVDRDTLVTPAGAYRFAGGHVHIGYENPNKVPDFVVTALCDATMGLSSILDRDEQGMRRWLYGAAGRYRPTDYGIEYRVLSNYWTFSAERAYAVGLHAQLVGETIERADPEELQHFYKQVPWDAVAATINTENRTNASRLWRYIQSDLKMEDLLP